MRYKGINVFYTKPGAYDKLVCRACGAECDVRRNCLGRSGFAMGMAGRSALHDVFECPHTGEEWHKEAVALAECAAFAKVKCDRKRYLTELNSHLRESGVECQWPVQ